MSIVQGPARKREILWRDRTNKTREEKEESSEKNVRPGDSSPRTRPTNKLTARARFFFLSTRAPSKLKHSSGHHHFIATTATTTMATERKGDDITPDELWGRLSTLEDGHQNLLPVSHSAITIVELMRLGWAEEESKGRKPVSDPVKADVMMFTFLDVVHLNKKTVTDAEASVLDQCFPTWRVPYKPRVQSHGFSQGLFPT